MKRSNWALSIISALVILIPIVSSARLAYATEGIQDQSAEPTPTVVASAAPTASPTPDPSAAVDPSADPAQSPAAEPTPTTQPEQTSSPESTPNPTQEPTPEQTGDPAPTEQPISGGGGSSGPEPEKTPTPWYVDPGRASSRPEGSLGNYAIISGGKTINVIVLDPSDVKVGGGASWVDWFNSENGRNVYGEGAVLVEVGAGDWTQPGHDTVLGEQPTAP